MNGPKIDSSLFSDKERFLIADWTINMICSKLNECEIAYNNGENCVRNIPGLEKGMTDLSKGVSEKIGDLMSLILFNGSNEQRKALWKIINLYRGSRDDGRDQ